MWGLGSPWRSSVLLGAVVAAGSIGCSDSRICEAVLGRRFDLTQQCYGPPVELSGLRSCRTHTEKGVQAECVASPEGDLFMVTSNTAASFEGSAFRHGEALTSEETALCQRASGEIGFPIGASECSGGDGGS